MAPPGRQTAPGHGDGPPATEPIRRLLAAAAVDHHRLLGPLPDLPGDELIAVIGAAGLTGRGGAAFPTARKLAAVAAVGASGRRPVVVANGAEGEPASSKDRALLTRAPHLVLDGLTLAARATGASRAHLYAPADVLAGSIEPALRDRRDRPTIRLAEAPDTFLAGQESAVVAAIEGRPALPRAVPPPVVRRGVDGRPTLVLNVETLAQLALIARFGPGWFRSVGTPDEPGSRVVTLSGALTRPAVYEAAVGMTLAAVLSLAGGATRELRAVLIGGYHGGWVPWTDAAAALPFSAAALAPFGAAPGAGVVVALPATRCGLRAAAEVAGYLAGQNAGQCGPCRNGLPTLAGQLHTLGFGRPDRHLVAELARVADLVDGRGACHHPNGTIRFVRSTLRAFADDVDAHLSDHCLAAMRPGGSAPAGRGGRR